MAFIPVHPFPRDLFCMFIRPYRVIFALKWLQLISGRISFYDLLRNVGFAKKAFFAMLHNGLVLYCIVDGYKYVDHERTKILSVVPFIHFTLKIWL